MKLISFILTMVSGVLFSPQENIVAPLQVYRIIDDRIYGPINQCIQRVKDAGEIDSDIFCISFTPPHVDTIYYYDIEDYDISDSASMIIRKVDYTTLNIQALKHMLFDESLGTFVYKGYNFFIINPHASYFKKTNEMRLCKFAPKLLSIDDRFMWRYKFDPQKGYEEIVPPNNPLILGE